MSYLTTGIKFKQMKILITTISIMFIIILGCTNEVEFNERDYIIENNTNFKLNIKFYNKTSGSGISGLSGILDSQGLRLNNTIELTSEFDDFRVPFVGADSVKIVLNEDRLITYTYDSGSKVFSEPINRNLFRHSNYENIGNKQYLFKITQQDYENALPCDGKCD